MIPKRIFTVWLGEKDAPLPPLIERCIESQRIPGYEHRLITLENCNEESRYTQECLAAWERTKDVRFLVKASDFIRCYHVWEEGGIHLDADMEVLPGKNFDDMLDDRMFTENEVYGCVANAGFGAEKGHPFLKEYMRRVEDNFRGGGDMIFDPGIRAFSDLMFITDKEAQGIRFYPAEVFFPYKHGEETVNITPLTRVFHHYAGSWTPRSKINTDWHLRKFF